MGKTMMRICALLLLIFFATGLLGPRVYVSVAQSREQAAQRELPFVPGRLLVGFKSKVSKSQKSMMMADVGVRSSEKIPGTRVQIIELPEFADEQVYLDIFRAQPDVEFAELDQIVPPAAMTPNDPLYGDYQAWSLPKIGAPGAWPTTTGSSSVTIAILDTGVDATHEDLGPKMVFGWNFYNNNSDTRDVYGHGTKVAGTAAAASNNAMGVASVAWGCRIMPIRISDASGNATYSAMANGLTWAADHGARVANISYIASNSSAVSSAARYFQTKGGVVTVSAGNNSTFDSSADNPYVLTVSATDQWDVLSYFSNTGNNIDLAAPEGSYTTKNGGGYTYAGGTSISAPTVAGVAALVLSANPSLTAAQVQDILKQSADDFGTQGWDTSYGSGRVNAARAVSLASGGGGQPGDTAPPTVTFVSPVNGATASGTATVQLSANDNVGVTSVNLSVDGTALGTDATSPYTFAWNTTTWTNGPHTLTATASDAAGNATSASITVTVSNYSDTTPPAISITSPANGAKVSSNVSVYVSAVDDTRVVKVELYVDGSLVTSSTSAPFTTKWNSRKAAPGSHMIQCKAYDGAGNIGVSASVTLYK